MCRNSCPNRIEAPVLYFFNISAVECDRMSGITLLKVVKTYFQSKREYFVKVLELKIVLMTR